MILLFITDYDRNPRYRINTTIECGDGLTVGYETEEEYEAAVGFNNVNNRIEMYVNCTDIYGNVSKILLILVINVYSFPMVMNYNKSLYT